MVDPSKVSPIFLPSQPSASVTIADGLSDLWNFQLASGVAVFRFFPLTVTSETQQLLCNKILWWGPIDLKVNTSNGLTRGWKAEQHAICQGKEGLECFFKKQGNISHYEKVVNYIWLLMKLGWCDFSRPCLKHFTSTLTVHVCGLKPISWWMTSVCFGHCFHSSQVVLTLFPMMII